MTWRRRDFLRTLGVAWGALGFSGYVQPSMFSQSALALGQFRGRKLALLVGINHYGPGINLGGAPQDLKIQRNLLENRFGFAAENILTLQDEQATVSGFLAAFQTVLQNRVQSDDLIFVHFSGYGIRLQSDIGAIPALVLPGTKGPEAIALSTVQRLLQTLNPAQAVLVLDTSFDNTPHSLGAYWHSRTYPKSQPTPALVNLEEDAQSGFGLGRSPLIQLLAAAQGVTPEIQINGVAVGLFTATLGEYLSAFDPLGTVTSGQSNFAIHLPRDEAQPATVQLLGTKSAALYGVAPEVTTPAPGNVMAQSATGIGLYLGGLGPEILQAIAPGSEFIALGESSPKILLTSKTGVFGQGKASSQDPSPGTILQEVKRHLPHSLSLKIAFAEELSRIERVDATSAFANIAHLATVSGPQDWVDYVFEDGYQLSTITGKNVAGIVPVSDANEAIQSSVARLQPRLEQLLALKWLRLLANETSTQLSLKLQLQRLDRFATVVTEKNTPLRVGQPRGNTSPQAIFALAEKGLYRLENNSGQPLFALGFAQSPKQELFLLTPKEGVALNMSTVGTTLEFSALRPLGTWIIYWIIGDRPFSNFQNQVMQQFGELETMPQKLEKPLPLIQALLSDLHQTSPEGTEATKDTYVLATNQWAGLHLRHTVVEAG